MSLDRYPKSHVIVVSSARAILDYQASAGRLPRRADFEAEAALPAPATVARLFGTTRYRSVGHRARQFVNGGAAS